MYPYNAFNGANNGFNTQGQTLIRVNGLDGAKAYQMMPNSTVALFDSSNDIFYIKISDGAGFPTIRQFRFEEVTEQKMEECAYITRKDMEEYVKQLISEQSTDTTK